MHETIEKMKGLKQEIKNLKEDKQNLNKQIRIANFQDKQNHYKKTNVNSFGNKNSKETKEEAYLGFKNNYELDQF